MSQSIITLLTDFGTSDSYVAQMKGVLLSGCPNCVLVDITHHVGPQDIRTAARILAEAVPRFPDGTVHLAVVDPGVGTDRSILAVQWETQRLVLPDNGLVTELVRKRNAAGIHAVLNDQFFSSAISPTFHGRDIMAWVAAYLASGGQLAEVGPRLESSLLLPEERPAVSLADGSWQCQVIGVDRFGNVILNSCQALIDALKRKRLVDVSSPGQLRRMARVVQTYGQASEKELVVLVDSQGRLELAQVNGSAAAELAMVPDAILTLQAV